MSAGLSSFWRGGRYQPNSKNASAGLKMALAGTINATTHLQSGFEVRRVLRGHGNFLAGFWISAKPRGSVVELKAAESANLDAVVAS